MKILKTTSTTEHSEKEEGKIFKKKHTENPNNLYNQHPFHWESKISVQFLNLNNKIYFTKHTDRGKFHESN